MSSHIHIIPFQLVNEKPLSPSESHSKLLKQINTMILTIAYQKIAYLLLLVLAVWLVTRLSLNSPNVGEESLESLLKTEISSEKTPLNGLVKKIMEIAKFANVFKPQMRLTEYFGLSNDASQITWSHAVNSKTKLDETLKSELMFLEADILYENEMIEPIMAHPPQTDSDITFKEWLDRSVSSRKGLKLDFKSPKAVEPCLNYVQELQEQISAPVILNADVFQGANSAPSKFNPHQFIDICLRSYPKGVLSLGWTTSAQKPYFTYSWQNIYNSLQVLSNYSNVTNEITFPVRASWSVRCIFRLSLLLESIKDSTLTVWSHENDHFSSLDTLLLLRKHLPPSSVYFDLPKTQDDHLRSFINGPNEILEKTLENSEDELIRFYEDGNCYNSSQWTAGAFSDAVIYQGKHSVLMLNKGAYLTTKREYQATGSSSIYEIRGSFEIFALQSSDLSQSKLDSQANAAKSNSDPDNISIRNSMINSEGCARLIIRGNQLSEYQSINELDTSAHSQGSINVYIYTNGTIKLFVGDKLEQEASIQASNRFDYSITDLGEKEDVHIDVTSFDSELNKYSLQMVAKSQYYDEQKFFVSKVLLSSDYGVGIDCLNIYDEIRDPLDLDSEEAN